AATACSVPRAPGQIRPAPKPAQHPGRPSSLDSARRPPGSARDSARLHELPYQTLVGSCFDSFQNRSDVLAGVSRRKEHRLKQVRMEVNPGTLHVMLKGDIPFEIAVRANITVVL